MTPAEMAELLRSIGQAETEGLLDKRGPGSYSKFTVDALEAGAAALLKVEKLEAELSQWKSTLGIELERLKAWVAELEGDLKASVSSADHFRQQRDELRARVAELELEREEWRIAAQYPESIHGLRPWMRVLKRHEADLAASQQRVAELEAEQKRTAKEARRPLAHALYDVKAEKSSVECELHQTLKDLAASRAREERLREAAQTEINGLRDLNESLRVRLEAARAALAEGEEK